MRTVVAIVLTAGIAAVGISGAVQERALPTGQTSTSIKGVWRAVEQTINDRTLKDGSLGVGFHVYTDGYFAAVRESDVPPRPAAPADNATAAQLLATYGPFVAQFGTYEVAGDMITETVLVAKNVEAAGRSNTRRFRIEGNTLITEPVRRTPGTRAITLKFIRVE